MTESTELLYFDANGYAWKLDPETGGIDEEVFHTWYEDEGCVGDAVGEATTARMARRYGLAGYPTEPSTWYVRPDNLGASSVTVKSRWNGGAYCMNWYVTGLLVVPLDEMIPVAPPTLAWVGPLHREQ